MLITASPVLHAILMQGSCNPAVLVQIHGARITLFFFKSVTTPPHKNTHLTWRLESMHLQLQILGMHLALVMRLGHDWSRERHVADRTSFVTIYLTIVTGL